MVVLLGRRVPQARKAILGLLGQRDHKVPLVYKVPQVYKGRLGQKEI